MCVCVFYVIRVCELFPHRWYFYVTSSLPTMQQGSRQARVSREAAACPFTAANSLSAAFVLSLTAQRTREKSGGDLKSCLLTAPYTSCCLRGPFYVRKAWLSQTLVGFEGSDLIIYAFGGFLHPEAQTSIKTSVRVLTDTGLKQPESNLVCFAACSGQEWPEESFDRYEKWLFFLRLDWSETHDTSLHNSFCKSLYNDWESCVQCVWLSELSVYSKVLLFYWT